MKNLLDKYLPIEFRLFLQWVFLFLIIFLAVPLTSFLIWIFMPQAPVGLVIVDKTVSNNDYQEHRSIHWTLNHLKYVNSEGNLFDYKTDYFGIFPKKEAGEYTIKDIRSLSLAQTKDLIAKSNLIYYADTYGVYEDEATDDRFQGLSKKLYGGMDHQDIEFLKKSYEAEKTIISEFNSIASPTSMEVRAEFEKLAGVKWTGWIARYFDELDTILNEELPIWMIDTYVEQHDDQWGLSGSGMVFLKENGQIEILEFEKHTQVKVPSIVSSMQSQSKYGLPEVVKYPYWFDIMLVSREFEVISYYDIYPTDEGLSLLRNMGLPRYFPAAVVKSNGNGKFFYFAGDFADNPAASSSFRFYGIAKLWRMFLHSEDYSQRNSFFWNYYFPLMKTILSNLGEAETVKTKN